MAGRPRVLSRDERKAKKNVYSRLRRSWILNIGPNMLTFWKFIKSEHELERDSDVAKLLIESYFEKTGRTLEQVRTYLQTAESDENLIEDGRDSEGHNGLDEEEKAENKFKANSVDRTVEIEDDTKPNNDNAERVTFQNLSVKEEADGLEEDYSPEKRKITLIDTKDEFEDDDEDDDEDLEYKDDKTDFDYALPGVSASGSDDTLGLDLDEIKTKVRKKRKKKMRNECESPKKRKRDKVKKEPKLSKEAKVPKPKKPKVVKKEVEEKPVKPWISIKLDEHTDKFTIERMESFERKNRGSSLFDDMYSCLVCGQFKSVGKEVFEDHLEQHINKVYECNKCNYISFSNADIARHKQICMELKKEGREYVCHLCGFQMVSKGDKVAHMGTMHGMAELPCRFCNEMFTTKHLRKKHYRTVHTVECQFCSSCNMGLSNISKDEYLKHVEGCIPGHQCQMCGKLFLRKQGLDHHVTYTHLKVRKFKCTMCPYTATTPDKLKLHILAHNGIHPYNCDQCTFSCVQPYQLKSHMRTHTGEKPFKCDQCNYAAAWNVQLKEHKKAHTMETAVLCQICNIVFKNLNVLSMHQKKEHSNNHSAINNTINQTQNVLSTGVVPPCNYNTPY